MKIGAPAAAQRKQRDARRRLGRPRLLIVGCGDIGLRIVARLGSRFRVFGLIAGPERAGDLREAGAVPIVVDLDRPGGPSAWGRLAPRLIDLAPPSPDGAGDRRTRRLRAALREPPSRLVYVSTTGVYGDHGGAHIDETARTQPATDRALRRLDAERQLRAPPWSAVVLRVPGIYGRGRLPLDRLRRATPALAADDDVVTHHVHADDLARICIAALYLGAPGRVYNAVDDSCLPLGDYLDRVADRFGLPRPPRLPRAQLQQAVSPIQYSFMAESRRLANRRLKRELRVRLQFPDVDAGLAAIAASADGG
jgi:nucleoside-diphosphate-sugar epimerase